MGALIKAVGALVVAVVVIVGISWLGDVLVPEKEVPVPKIELASPDKKDVPVKPLPQLLAEADVEKGTKTAKQCLTCHTFGEGQAAKVGPNLYDVVGRAKASESGFAYSEAMKGKGGSWTYEDLNAFLTSPKDFVPKTKMAFVGLRKPEDRANVIAYLHSLNPKAPPLPAVEAAPAGTPETPDEQTSEEPAPVEQQQPPDAPAETPQQPRPAP